MSGGSPALVRQATGTSTVHTTTTATFGAGATAGNIIWAALACDKNAGTFTDPSGTWNRILAFSSTSVSIYVAWKIATGGETAITVVNSTATSAGNELWIGEYSQSGTDAWTIEGSATHQTDESTSAAWSSGTTGSTTGDGRGLAFFAIDSGQSITSGRAFTNSYALVNTPSASGRGSISVASVLVSSGTASTTTQSYTGTADQTSACIVVFARVGAGDASIEEAEAGSGVEFATAEDLGSLAKSGSDTGAGTEGAELTVSLTAAGGNASVTFAVLSDLQITSSWSTAMGNAKTRIAALAPDYLLVSGDVADGGLASAYTIYGTNMAAYKSTTVAMPGNHDYSLGNADNWFAYFGTGTMGQGTSAAPWYSVDVAGWHVVALVAASGSPGSGQPSYLNPSAQYTWLGNDLAANAGKPILAIWHEARYSDDNSHGDEPNAAAIWNLLESYHADLVISGHVHIYQRFPAANGSGGLDAAGIVGFTNSGINTRGTSGTDSALTPDYKDDVGLSITVFTLGPSDWSWSTVRVSDGAVIDSGTKDAHLSAGDGESGSGIETASLDIQLARAVADNAAAADTVAKNNVRARSVSDGAGASDVVVAAVQSTNEAQVAWLEFVIPKPGIKRGVADSAPAVDTVGAVFVPGITDKAGADTGTGVESNTRLITVTGADGGVGTDIANLFVTRTVTDTGTGTETTAKFVSLVAPIADAAAAVDALSRQLVTSRPRADTALAVDVVGRQLSLPRSSADTAAATDVVVRVLPILRTTADSAPAVDTVTRTSPKTRPAADNAVATDVVIRSQTPQDRALADSAPAVDAVTRFRTPPTRLLSDSAPAVDTVIRSQTPQTRAIADSTPAADVVVRTFILPRVIADSAPAVDVVVRTAPKARTTADGAPATDTLVRSQTPQTRSIAQSVPATDVVVQTSTKARSTSDTALALDTVLRARSAPRAASDIAAAIDGDVRTLQQTRAVSDLASVLDTVGASGLHNIAKSVIDAAPASDLVTTRIITVRASADTAPATDVVVYHRTMPRVTADTAPATDLVGAVVHPTRSVVDTALATDTTTARLSAPRAASDTASAVDGVVRQLARTRAVVETALGADVVGRLLTQARTTADTVPATDTAISSGVHRLTGLAPDAAPAVDVVVRTLPQIRTCADAALSTDAVARVYSQPRPVADTAHATDVVVAVAQRHLTSALGDLAPATDAVLRVVTKHSTVTDSAPATDLTGQTHTWARALPDLAQAFDLVTTQLVFERSATDDAPAQDVIHVSSTAGYRDIITIVGPLGFTWHAGPPVVGEGWVIAPKSSTTKAGPVVFGPWHAGPPSTEWAAGPGRI